MDIYKNLCYKINIMKIGEFSKITKLPVLTIRYYMELGLLKPRRVEQYWDFSVEDVSRAAAIARYKDCGFTLQAISDLFSLLQAPTTSPKERNNLIGNLLAHEQQRILLDQRQLIDSLGKLDSMIHDIKGQVVTDVFNGIPLFLFSKVCCPYCGKPLCWECVQIKNDQVCSGIGGCPCGARVSVVDGILIVEDIQTPLIPVVDHHLATLQQRSPQDISYIESFNQWIKLQLNQLELGGKIIFEDVLNTACFLNRAISELNPNAYFILCDTDIQVVRYYMASIRAAYPDGKFLFLVDDGIHHPLKEGCLDVIIDYAASEVYQKYGYCSSSTPLHHYVHDGTIVAGRFSRRCKKQVGRRDPSEDTPNRYSLQVLLKDMQKNGITIFAEKIGNKSVDPRVYTGALSGDIIKPYAFIGRWTIT